MGGGVAGFCRPIIFLFHVGIQSSIWTYIITRKIARGCVDGQSREPDCDSTGWVGIMFMSGVGVGVRIELGLWLGLEIGLGSGSGLGLGLGLGLGKGCFV